MAGVHTNLISGADILLKDFLSSTPTVSTASLRSIEKKIYAGGLLTLIFDQPIATLGLAVTYFHSFNGDRQKLKQIKATLINLKTTKLDKTSLDYNKAIAASNFQIEFYETIKSYAQEVQIRKIVVGILFATIHCISIISSRNSSKLAFKLALVDALWPALEPEQKKMIDLKMRIGKIEALQAESRIDLVCTIATNLSIMLLGRVFLHPLRERQATQDLVIKYLETRSRIANLHAILISEANILLINEQRLSRNRKLKGNLLPCLDLISGSLWAYLASRSLKACLIPGAMLTVTSFIDVHTNKRELQQIKAKLIDLRTFELNNTSADYEKAKSARDFQIRIYETTENYARPAQRMKIVAGISYTVATFGLMAYTLTGEESKTSKWAMDNGMLVGLLSTACSFCLSWAKQRAVRILTKQYSSQ